MPDDGSPSGKPWYSDSWTDWINPLAYGAWISAGLNAEGTQLGGRIGSGYAAAFVDDPTLSGKLDALNQDGFLGELASDPNGAAIGDGSLSNPHSNRDLVDRSGRYLDGVLATGELGLEVYSIVDGGMAVGGVLKGMAGAGAARAAEGAAAQSIKGRIKAAGLPTTGRIRYVPPKGYSPGNPLPNGSIRDRFGNLWKKGRPLSRSCDPFEWDVQLGKNATEGMRKLSKDGFHVNVSPLGQVTH